MSCLSMSRRGNKEEKKLTIAHLIAQQEREIASIDEEIYRLADIIQERTRHKAQVKKSLFYYRSFAAPIAQLPNEILAMIFFEYVSNSPPWSQFLLVQVCHRWKDLVYASRCLWTRVCFAPPFADANTLKAVQSHLKRAGTLPLAVSIDLSAVKRAFSLVDICAVLDGTISSWVGLQIKTPNTPTPMSQHLPLLKTMEKKDLTSLTSFTFRTHWGNWWVEQDELTRQTISQLFSRASGLKSFCIPRRFLDFDHQVYKQVRDLEIYRCTYADGSDLFLPRLLGYLPNWTQLESLAFSTEFFRQASNPLQSFTLPHLTRLSIANIAHLDVLFKTTRVPKLTDLSLEGIDSIRGVAELSEAFKSLVEQPTGTPKLEKLRLHSVPCPEKGLIWLLEHLPTLVDLQLASSRKIGPSFVEALIRWPTSRRGWMCPQLRSISVQRCNFVTRYWME